MNKMVQLGKGGWEQRKVMSNAWIGEKCSTWMNFMIGG